MIRGTDSRGRLSLQCLIVVLNLSSVGEGLAPPALFNAMLQKAFPCEGILSQATVEFALQTSRGPLAVDE